MLPPGLTHKDKEAETRALWESNPTAILKIAVTNKMSASGHVEGVEQLADDGAAPQVEQKNRKEMGITVGGCINGVWQ